MRYALFTFVLGAASFALAQDRPQMTWEGYVSGSAVLYVQEDRVDVQGRDTGAVDRPRYRFASPLPAVRQRAEVDVRRGRGRVQILEQPTPGNEYSLIVRIDPAGSRPELYAVDFYWRSNGNSRYDEPSYDRSRRGRRNEDIQTRGRTNDRMGPGDMGWSGTVDQEAVIEVRGRRAVARTLRGRPVYGEKVEFSSAMPRNATVRLENVQGRGRVELVQQPSESGSYAAVRILDDQRGAGQYSFRLVWDDSEGGYSSSNDRYDSQSGVLTPGGSRGGLYEDSTYGSSSYGSENAMRWSGRVDGRVRVSVQRNRAWATRIEGGRITGEQVNFGSPLPSRNVSEVDVQKRQGRGDVEIVEQPSRSNGYTFVFEIDDPDAGADDYVVEVTWR